MHRVEDRTWLDLVALGPLQGLYLRGQSRPFLTQNRLRPSLASFILPRFVDRCSTHRLLTNLSHIFNQKTARFVALCHAGPQSSSPPSGADWKSTQQGEHGFRNGSKHLLIFIIPSFLHVSHLPPFLLWSSTRQPQPGLSRAGFYANAAAVVTCSLSLDPSRHCHLSKEWAAERIESQGRREDRS